MKKIVTLLLLFISINTIAQIDTNTTCYTDTEVLNISNYIKDLEQKDSLNTILLSQYSTQIQLYKTQSKQDSLLFVYKQQEVDLLNYQVNNYIKLVNITTPKWYERKLITFTAGMVTVWGTLYVSNKIQ